MFATRTTAFARTHWLLLAGCVVGVGARLAFWALTNRTWEDALITLAHVRNAAEGNGLTHHAGEGAVHGFTSALSVLIPLSSEVIASGTGLTVMRIASLIAAVLAIGYGYAIARRIGLSQWPTAFVVAYLALDQLHIFFGMSGMETQVAVATLLAAVYYVLRGQAVATGVASGLTALARPDLAVWLILAIAWSLSTGRWSGLKTAATASILVVPWLIFTTLYYGSPIPHTILAKAAAYSATPGVDAAWIDWIGWAGEQVGTSVLALLRAFMPFYEDGAVVAAPIPASLLSLVGIAMLVLAVLGAWRTRNVTSWRPALAYVAIFLVFWLLLVPPVGYFNWYLPPFTALVAILVGAGLERLFQTGPRVSVAATIGLVLATGAHIPWSFPLDARIQAEIDDGVRRTAGLYLGTVVPRGEAVVAEPAGYLGYYSRATLWDYPGLTSPTSYAALISLPAERRSVAELLVTLEPSWAALRPNEWDAVKDDHPAAAACYSIVKTVGTPQAPVVGLNGLVKWNQDWSFIVLRRDCSSP